MSIITSISSLFHKVLTWIKGAEDKLHPAIKIAEDLVNALKSPQAETVEAIIETIVPASTGLINAVKLLLPSILEKLKWVDTEVTKDLNSQWDDAIKYLESLKGTDEYAVQLNSLKALLTKFFAQNAGQDLTIQQALVLSQPTHDISTIA